ncbi:MAG: hypothetical protein AAGI01_14370, partial [Myxococcota bacterium]
ISFASNSAAAPMTNFRPAVLFYGVELRNQGVLRLVYAREPGGTGAREVFVPTPGWYTVTAGDIRTFLGEPPIGGAASQFGYELSVSEPPIYEPTATLAVPSPANTNPFEPRPRFFEINAASVTSMTINHAIVNIGGADISYTPMLSVYDPDTGRAVAYTTREQLIEKNAASLNVLLRQGAHQRLYVVEDFLLRGPTEEPTLVTTVSAQDHSVEVEPALPSRNDRRQDTLTWLDIGAKVDGAIDAPTMREDGELEGDEDVYLFNAPRGETLEVVVTPRSSSMLIPWVRLGRSFSRLRADQTIDDFFSTLHEHRPEDEDTDMRRPRQVRYIITQDDEGEMAVSIQHRPNHVGGNEPVGGKDSYGYTVEVRRLSDFEPQEFAAIPGSADVVVEQGSMGALKFDAQAGEFLSVDIDIDVPARARVYRADNFEVLRNGFGDRFEIQTTAAGTYWIDVLGSNGRGADDPVTVTVNAVRPEPFGAIPGTQSGVLENAGQEDFYTLQVTEGQKLDFRIASPNFTARIELLEPDSLDDIERGTRLVNWVADRTGEIILKVTTLSSARGPDQTYTLGVEEIMPTDLGAPPSMATTTIDNEPFQQWYSVQATAGEFYELTATATSGAFTPSIRVVDPDTLETLVQRSRELRWSTTVDREIWVNIYDSRSRGRADFDVDFTFGLFTPNVTALDTPTVGQLPAGDAIAYYLVPLGSPGLTDVRVATDIGWPVDIRLLDPRDLSALSTFEGGRQVFERYAHATSTVSDVLVEVSSDDTGLMGPLNFTLEVTHTPVSALVPENEPNSQATPELLAQVPAYIAGALDSTTDLEDVFSIDLT